MCGDKPKMKYDNFEDFQNFEGQPLWYCCEGARAPYKNQTNNLLASSNRPAGIYRPAVKWQHLTSADALTLKNADLN